MTTYDVVFYMPTLTSAIAEAEHVTSIGGAETQIWLLARGLARQGRAVAVVVSDIPGGLPGRFDGVDVVVRTPWRAGGGIRGKARELVTLWRALAPLQSDVVVQRNAGLATGLVAAVARLTGRRFVYSSAHVAEFTLDVLPLSANEIRLFKLGIRLADVIVAQTDEQARLCRERFGRAALVIRSIAEPASPRVGAPDTFLWIGRLVDYKRPEAFLELARALPTARFRLVGVPAVDQPQVGREVQRLAQELPNVELLAPRSRPELLRLYDDAVAVVSTSRSEGMPNVFLEGWARGIPALALSHDPDGVIEANRIGACARDSPAELASLAAEIWSTRHDQSEVAVRCREYIRREHSLETAIARWSSALRLKELQSLPAPHPPPVTSSGSPAR